MAKKKRKASSKPDLSHIHEELRELAVPVGSLKYDSLNPMKHRRRNLDAIEASLRGFGQRDPLVARADTREVIGGNARLQVAQEALGWTHVAVLFVDDDSKTAHAFAVADNKTARLSKWDSNRLAKLMARLNEEQQMLTGFNSEEIDTMLQSIGEGFGRELDTSPKLDGSKFRVVVDCKSEKSMKRMARRLEKMGHNVFTRMV